MAESIKLLVDELKSEDITVRINAVKRISTIAVALGPERTRQELIPFLTESIDDEDEVLVSLAEELGGFVRFVGGPPYAPCLLPPLEIISQQEETLVRDQAVASLVNICEDMSAGDVLQHMVPMITRLSSADWFTSKVSASGVIAVAYRKCTDTATRETLRRTFRALCEDESPMVRRAASSNLPALARVVEPAIVSSDIVPIFLTLADDEQDSVRLLAVANCVAVATLLGPDDAAENVLPTFRGCATAKSWRVRYMVADQIVELSQSVSKEVVSEEMLPLFVRLLVKDTESEAEVRTAAARKVTAFSKLLPIESVLEVMIPTIALVASDASQHVRSSLASCVTGMAPICGPQHTMAHLIPLFLQLLKDDIPEVRLNIISNIESVNSVVGVASLSQSLLPAIMDLASDKQWRVRMAIIEYVPLLAQQLGVEFFESKDNDHLLELCFTWLGDCVFTIREASINNLKRLALTFGSDWTDAKIVPRVVLLKEHKNYLYRITALFAVTALAEVVGQDALANQLLPLALELANDTVPNIRFNVCKTLATVIGVVNGGSVIAQTRIRPTLQRLQDTDQDPDVKHFAEEAIQLLA
eukprot:c10389_g1_i1.p1 GENE.c10389_g1_i1~~c10389_g1_i1.p1  ORF type:complete len:603 (-),score=174.90 c10389_g1_i1:429-2189(-)